MEAVSEEKERNNQLRRDLHQDWLNALECDDDMGDARDGVCGLSVDSKVFVLPEDLGFISLGGWVEVLGVHLGVECGVDYATHSAEWWRHP